MGREKKVKHKVKITIEDTDANSKYADDTGCKYTNDTGCKYTNDTGGKGANGTGGTAASDTAIKAADDDDSACRVPLTKGIKARTVGTKSDRPIKKLKLFAIIIFFCSVILLAAVIILAVHIGVIHYCFIGIPIIPVDTENPGVFQDMSVDEYKAVLDYMLYKSKIGLTRFEKATVNSSYIYMIDLHIPLKTSVLEHLDRGSIRIKRAAKVVVIRGNLATPKVEEYLVSPIPNPRTHILARNPSYARFPIPYTSRPVDNIDYDQLFKMINDFSEKAYHILIESYGLCYHNCTKGVNCMIFRDVAPRGQKSGQRDTWFWSFRDVEGYYLQPLGLELQINHTSNNIKEWKIDKIVYNGQLVYTVRDLIEQYESKRMRKIKFENPSRQHRDIYSSYTRRGQSEMAKPLQGPRFYEPDAKRYTIFGQHVKYMHWDFDVRMRPSTGLQIFDVRFQSERIAYEISLQDAVIFHTGYGPSQTISNLYLTSWMIGASSFELVRGIDCPDTASFLDTHNFVNSGVPLHYKNSICIFEVNPGIPLRRHYTNNYAGGYKHYGGIVDYHLIVRHIATIWNGDYIFDYIFRLNGEIEIRVSTTGYVQATYKLPFEQQYGNPLYFDVNANVHQQLFHFKIDLDIGRQENRYSVLDVDLETIRHPWYSKSNKTQFVLSERKMEREMDIVVDDSDNPRYHLIYDKYLHNKYKTKRAYRILNKSSSKYLLDYVPVTNAAKWAKYPLVITKYDDTEDLSSSIYAQNDPWNPVVDFERFVSDNDTIVNEDLVAWATLGMYHIPHTEDVPSTSTSWNKLSLHLIPFNFFTECPSVSSPSAVHITPDKNKENINVDTFGTTYESTCVPPIYGPSTFYGYRDAE
ncbi:amiloride-sensitive amine oxidase [copper-containing]-like [Ruditapes philippinarum]|uniref:amiloride-sensitive amine oxidase [copper-containing]-like n=1 Tax=Ruditapes philippinarum TaxID=129788 RepID=UPI00295B6764|nr:amiloride-sensitive amine oxidase [copper-containing]-like [Ruditapes philippinarum]XP_060551797.1 amiloride-sensitive amine oxidase [copper-containing]-like [Ruditapes philippinarum]